MKRPRTLRFEQLETRQLFNIDVEWLQNTTRPLDVNDDGSVSPMDVLLIVEGMSGSRGAGTSKHLYMDVSGDHCLSPMDVLMIVDYLNSGTPALGPSTDLPRSVDGSDNNLRRGPWGAAGTTLLRVTKAAYSDAQSSPAGNDRPNPRVISNAIAAQDGSLENDRGMTSMVWQWGQFLDHDIDLTGELEPHEDFPITMPAGDEFFDPTGSGQASIPLHRSVYEETTGQSANNPRQQINQVSAFIDGSNVYGSDTDTASRLRTFTGGRLKTSDSNLLPIDEEGMFIAGDVRANEHVGLTAMHTLFVREHNRLANEIADADPELDDETIYQRARSMVIGELQAITFNEFLPALLGDQSLDDYSGYDDTLHPGIANIFSTAAYRIGHSMLNTHLPRLDEAGQEAAGGHLALRDAFFSPDEVITHGIDSVIRGLVSQLSQEIDALIVDDVRNFLFGPPGAGGFDLASLNIQRGRDHGLPSYNQARVELGLTPVTNFADITPDPDLQAALAEVYGNDVNCVDVWVGGLAEEHLPGSSVGELVSTVLSDQFHRLRAGDRYWYERVLPDEQVSELNATRLSDVIRRNTDVIAIQDDVFRI